MTHRRRVSRRVAAMFTAGACLSIAAALAAGCGQQEERPSRPGEERPPESAEAPAAAGPACRADAPALTGERVVGVYYTCESAMAGALVPVRRTVEDTARGLQRARLETAMRALLAGPTRQERERGFSSFFSEARGVELLDARLSESGDTAWLDFTSFEGRLPDRPGVKSFVPPGVMAELTWTLFQSFPDLQAVRFALDGSEEAFWAWLGGPAQVFTRRDWERV